MVHVIAGLHLILVMHVIDTILVVRIKLPVLLQAHFLRTHPEGALNGNRRDRSFHGGFRVAAHQEVSRRDSHEIHLHSVAQIKLYLRIGTLLGLGGIRRKRPASWGCRAELASVGGFRFGFDEACCFLIWVMDLFGISDLFSIILLVEFHAPLEHILACSGLRPSAVVRRVEVDPGHQVVPRLVVEFDIMMALFQHLDEFAGIGMKLQRHQ